MKATLKAKIVVEQNPDNFGYSEISYNTIKKMIESGKCEVEFIDWALSNDVEPTIIIKEKK